MQDLKLNQQERIPIYVIHKKKKKELGSQKIENGLQELRKHEEFSAAQEGSVQHTYFFSGNTATLVQK